MNLDKYVDVDLIVLFKLEKAVKEVLKEKVLECNNKVILLVLLLIVLFLVSFVIGYNDEAYHKHLSEKSL